MANESLDSQLLRVGQGVTPWKGACRVVMTSAVALSGLPVIDGVQLVTGDRVLRAVGSSPLNGVYVAQAGAWSRAVDLAVNMYWQLGVTVTVLAGTTYAGSLWTLTSPSNGKVELGVTALTFTQVVNGAAEVAAIAASFTQQVSDLADQVATFDARVDALEDPDVWEPSQIAGAYFWAKGITDPALRTMTGSRVDEIRNAINNGLIMTRSAGTPVIDSATVLNGFNPLRMDATTEIASVSGGPSGNAAHWIFVLTNGSDSAFSGMARAGALSAGGGVGVTTSQRYAAGLVAAEGVPRVDSPEPLANGALRVVGCQHMPNYGQLTVSIDGYSPPTASWNFAKTLSLNGTFALGKLETGGAVNTSAIYDVVYGTGTISASDRAKLLDYWVTKFSLARLAPRILVIGDSNSTTTPTSPATTSWVTLLTNMLTAQLAIDARTMPAITNIALSGKFAGGDWSVQGLTSPTMSYQADGNYVAFGGTNNNNQGQALCAPLSRSGRREYEIALVMGGTNDLISGNVTGAQMIGRAQYICTQLKSHGYYVILQTIIPGSSNSGYYGNGGPGTREVHRAAYNAWVVANAIADGYADRVVDHDGAGLVWNTTYFGPTPDVLHPNDVGHVLMANAVYAQVYDLIQEAA